MIKKIIIKYRKIPAAVKASVWFAICGILQKGISLITTPIFTRLLTTEQYGEFSLYQSWYSIISIFATLNLYYGVFNTGMTKYSDDRKKFTSSMQGLCTTITIVLFIIYLLFYKFWNNIFGLKTIYILLMFFELLFVPAFNFWAARERYDYKYVKLVVITLVMAIITPIISVIAVVNTIYKAEARIFTSVLVQVMFGIIFYIYNIKEGKKFFIKKYWLYALKFNIPLLPHYLSTVVLNQSDRIMIGNMVGKSEVALYSVSYTVALMMQIFVNAINNSYTPFMYKSFKSNNYEAVRDSSKIILLLICIMSIISMTLGPEIVLIFAAKSYYDARWVISPVACSVFFMFLYPLFSNIEFYYEKPKYIMYASCAGAALNVILNYIFIPILGYYAAGYTTLFCYILYSFAHYFFAKKICKKEKILKRIFDIKSILLLSIFEVLAMIIITSVYDFRTLRYIIFIIELASFVIIGKKYLKLNKNNTNFLKL